MAEPIPPSAQSSSYSLATLSSHVSTDRRAVTDMNGWYRRGSWMRTGFGRLRRRECCMLGTPSSHPTVSLHELPPARLVIHRQTSVHERRKWTRSVQSRSGIFAYLCTRQHWLWITVELHIPARATRRLLLGREVATLLYEDWSGLASGHSRHPVMHGSPPSPQDPTAMSPDHWSNLTWDTVSAGGHDL